MPFNYKRIIVSGTQEGVEGVSAALAEMSSFMQDCGWVLIDNRSDQPGTAVNSTHMKYVFSSQGEENNFPTFFVTMYSGTTSTVNDNVIGFDLHTAYDVGTHTVPASGIRTTSSEIASVTETISVPSQTDNTEIFMSGDSEMVHFVTRKQIVNNDLATMDNCYMGRFNSFFKTSENPYPLLLATSLNTAIVTDSNTGFFRAIGGEPPQAITPISTQVFFVSDANEPYNLGTVSSIFFARPILISYQQISPFIMKGVAGTVRNGWAGADATNLFNLSILTASGTFGSQEYQSFTAEGSFSQNSIILRKS